VIPAFLILFTMTPLGADQVDRLRGQSVSIGDDGRIEILDIAGEGRPLVGVVERRGSDLWLVVGGDAVRLRGPLATPRIAGPGYRVWVLGRRSGDDFTARRLGVLAAPARSL
jgi:hypothetical protein